MTQEDMKRVMKQVFSECNALREAGQKEYAHDKDNAFSNFDRAALHLDVDRRAILIVYLMKHIDGIIAYINGHESQRESITGRINDAIVYLCILRGMVEEAQFTQDTSTFTSAGCGIPLPDPISGMAETIRGREHRGFH